MSTGEKVKEVYGEDARRIEARCSDLTLKHRRYMSRLSGHCTNSPELSRNPVLRESIRPQGLESFGSDISMNKGRMKGFVDGSCS